MRKPNPFYNSCVYCDMKKIYPLLALFICFNSYCQADFKPADSASTWTGRSYTWVDVEVFDFESWHSVYAKASDYDTLIGLNSYTKLYHNSSNDPEQEIYYCSFRSDTIEKSLYIMPRDSTSEYLFFDFDAAHVIGETITIPFYGCDAFYNDLSAEFNVSEMQLTGIDSLLVDGHYLTYWYYDLGWDSSCGGPVNRFTIMERMITADAFPFTWTHSFESVRELKCYSENNVELYGDLCPYTYGQFLDVSHQDIEYNNDLIIYPNPNRGNFNLKYNTSEAKEITIYNLQGERVYSNWVESGTTNVNISNLKPGSYLVTLIVQEGILTQRLIVQ